MPGSHQYEASLAELSPISAKFGRAVANFGRIRAEFGPNRPSLVESADFRLEFDQIEPNAARVPQLGPIWVCAGEAQRDLYRISTMGIVHGRHEVFRMRRKGGKELHKEKGEYPSPHVRRASALSCLTSDRTDRILDALGPWNAVVGHVGVLPQSHFGRDRRPRIHPRIRRENRRPWHFDRVVNVVRAKSAAASHLCTNSFRSVGRRAGSHRVDDARTSAVGCDFRHRRPTTCGTTEGAACRPAPTPRCLP